MFRIAFCDDDKTLCIWIKKVLAAHEDQIPVECSMDTCYSGSELCKELTNGKQYDLIFLDIAFNERSHVNGVDVGKYIREKLRDNGTQIIYISYKSVYAMELFQNHPYDFLVKPLTEDKIIDSINKVIKLTVAVNHPLDFITKGEKHFVKAQEIMYLTSNLRKVILCAAGGTYEFYGSLSDVYKKLPREDFIFTHKSYLVNWLYIKSIKDDHIILTDDKKIPISRNYKKNVNEAFVRRTKGR